MRVQLVHDLDPRGGVQMRGMVSGLHEGAEAREDGVLYRPLRRAARGPFPVHAWAVHPAVVVAVVRVFEVGVVAREAQLVAHVDQGYPPVPEDEGVAQQDAPDGHLEQHVVPRLLRELQARKARQGAAYAPVAGPRVLLEDGPARVAAEKGARVVVAEEGSVRARVETDGRRVFVGYRPAYVVVAAGVGRPRGVRGLPGEAAEGVGHEPGVALASEDQRWTMRALW